MGFLRLGTRCAVLNDTGQILLSKRGDFGTWSLPGGRLDSGELLPDSAVREVREETGLEVEIVRAVGLYYQQGRSRINVLYRARPIGGQLLSQTDETLENRFFDPDELPDNIFGDFYIDDALDGGVFLHTQSIDPAELRKLQLKLAWRWLQNLFSGNPEPRFPQFEVQAIGIIWDDEQRKLLTLTDDVELLRVNSDGSQALNEALNDFVGLELEWEWAGLWQDTVTDRMVFVFEGTFSFDPSDLRYPEAKWQNLNAFNNTQEKHFIEVTRQRKAETVWLMEGQ